MLLQRYEPPTLVCAINEVLSQITCETSTTPTLLVPFILESPKLKGETRDLATSGSGSLYGVQIGPVTEVAQAMGAGTQKPPSTLQIHHEPLSCFLHLARIMKLPTFILIGQRSKSSADSKELEVFIHDLLLVQVAHC